MSLKNVLLVLFLFLFPLLSKSFEFEKIQEIWLINSEATTLKSADQLEDPKSLRGALLDFEDYLVELDDKMPINHEG